MSGAARILASTIYTASIHVASIYVASIYIASRRAHRAEEAGAIIRRPLSLGDFPL
jgi:hypothetical protein